MGVRAIQTHGRPTTQGLSPTEHAIPITWLVRLAPRRAGPGRVEPGRAGPGAEQQVVDDERAFIRLRSQPSSDDPSASRGVQRPVSRGMSTRERPGPRGSPTVFVGCQRSASLITPRPEPSSLATRSLARRRGKKRRLTASSSRRDRRALSGPERRWMLRARPNSSSPLRER